MCDDLDFTLPFDGPELPTFGGTKKLFMMHFNLSAEEFSQWMVLEVKAQLRCSPSYRESEAIQRYKEATGRTQ